ncbi:MAG: hypothetical protein II196_07130, partial [Spirochaetales bacterium]|nr:hypothetical protein [Spirochaetales bacterium]
YTEKSTAALFTGLTEAGVPYLDMREIYNEQGSLRSTSSLVDNHYSITGALAAYRAITEKWNADTNSNHPLPDAEDLSTQIAV